MRFSKFSQYLQDLESTASRNKMTEILAELFKKANANEIDKICYLSLGRLAPKFTGIEFNLAEKMMGQALARAYNREISKVRKLIKESGDLGDTAERLAKFKCQNSNVKTKSQILNLSVSEVYERLYEIAMEAGEGSVERKINKMTKLLVALDSQSAKYVTRIPLGRLRLGFSNITILDALSWMVVGDKSKRQEIEEAYNVRTDVGQIAKKLKIKNEKLKTCRRKSRAPKSLDESRLSRIRRTCSIKTSAQIKNEKLRVKKLTEDLKLVRPEIGIPIMPALCQRLPTAEKMIEKMNQVAVEPKYDGTRLQVHFSQKREWERLEKQLSFDFRPKGFVRTFTRDLENTTHMFPDLVQAVFKEVNTQEAILDCEAIGFNPRTGKFLPFQETIKRKRKHGVAKKAKEIPLKFFCFDILYKDGQDLLKTPFNKRRKILEKTINPKSKTIILTEQIITDNPQELRRYHQQQTKKGLEGVVVKKWEAPYDPGRRGFTWVKFKQEKGKKGGGLADTLDCLVMGYYKGKGKRASFGIGAFLVGIRKGEEFLTVSKIGTGLTDEQWREMKVRGSRFESRRKSVEVRRLSTGREYRDSVGDPRHKVSGVRGKPKKYRVDKNLIPDVWCNPQIVVEIEADNITKSPIHTAGYALRFPRLVRLRDDKNPNQATTLKELKNLYQLQG